MAINSSGITTASVGAAATLMMAGFPIEHAYLGKRGLVNFVFGPEAATIFQHFLRTNREIQETIARVKPGPRHQEIDHGQTQR